MRTIEAFFQHLPRVRTWISASAILLFFLVRTAGAAEFRAGAAAVDVSPQSFPVRIIGGFLEGIATQLNDPLYSRCLVLDDGATKIAIVVVDSCMMPRDLLDQAKKEASEKTGIPTEHMLISATHTHSAPACMGGLGTRVDEAYAKFLPGKIAESIVMASANLVPARIGWGSTNAPAHTFNRRWIFRSDKMGTDPFGRRTMRANMHPGYQNPDALGPSGPVDDELSVLSVQTRDGRPLALLANYSMHYFGAGAVSADYFGKFAEKMTRRIAAGPDSTRFVAMMSQGTSGDLMWMNYGAPASHPGLEAYSEAISQIAHEVWKRIEYRDHAPLAMAEATLTLRRRVDDPEKLEWAKPIVEALEGGVAKTIQQVYALEQLYLQEEPVRELVLQAARIGELGITALPNEVYAITGLKLKAQSPLRPTFNIELANGGEGYIPPPEQHSLGGYTTWPARTASLEVEAEPKIVEVLLSLLEKVSGQARRSPAASHGAYAKAVLHSKPAAYWRLEEMAGRTARDTSGNEHHARYEDRIAFYLDGPPGNFSEGAANRAVHFAGGRLRADVPELGADYTVELWLWNGLPHAVRGTTACLFSRAEQEKGDFLLIGGTNTAPGRLVVHNGSTFISGQTTLPLKQWVHVAFVRTNHHVTVYLNGRRELEGELGPPLAGAGQLFFGGDPENRANLEGKLDEIAIYSRALAEEEIARHEAASGFRQIREAEAVRSLAQLEGVTLPEIYSQTILASGPLAYWSMDAAHGSKIPDVTGRFHATAQSTGVRLADSSLLSSVSARGNHAASFTGGRIRAEMPDLQQTYSAAFWFRNTLPNNARLVTGYFFSRGPDGNKAAPGDHLGIGGTHTALGRLLFFNGNERNQVLAGSTLIEPHTWNHVVLVRDGRAVTVYLNGHAEPEISGQIDVTAPAGSEIFFGGRTDNFSNFQGQLDEVSLFDRVLTPDEVSKIYTASGRKVEIQKRPKLTPDTEAKSPEESLRMFHVKPGYEIELVVAEPLVGDPVAIDWGPDGKLWVAEMVDYPMGMDGKMKPGGRIRFLEDTTGDGRYDRSTVFLENVRFPKGLLPWRNGVLFTAAPEIFHAEDTTGDGRADKREVLFTGFREGNLQLRVNSLRMGLDNWIYCANGWSAGVAESLRTGQKVDLRGRDLRLRPDTGEIEAASGVTQFGLNRDDWNHWFGVNNSYPLWHYVLPDHYLKRNPHVAAPDPIVQLMLPANPKIYPALPPEKRYHNFHESGRFTSACASMIYRDELLFGADRILHAFISEPFHNLVHHQLVEDHGVTFKARRAEDERESEFLASEDRWFRPAMTRTGPDGALWVVDMYRYMIEHPDWLPPEGKTELEPFYRHGENLGRIYRIYPKGKKPGNIPRLDRLPAAELAKQLEHPNGWIRDTAQMLLIWRNDPAAVLALQELVEQSASALARVHAICTLDGLNALSTADLDRALNDPHPGVRQQAIRLTEPRSRQTSPLLDRLASLAADPDAKVRLQLAFTLGEWNDERAGKLLARIAVQHAAEPYITAAVMSSATNHCAVLAREVLSMTPEPPAALLEPLLTLSFALNQRDILSELLETVLLAQGVNYSQMQIFSRFLTVLDQRKTSIRLLRQGKDDRLSKTLAHADDCFASARRLAKDPRESLNRRLAATGLLGWDEAHRAPDLDLLASMLSPAEPPELQRAAVTALGRSADATVPALFAARWETLSPELLGRVLDEWIGREPWAADLLSRIARGEMAPVRVDATRRGRLVKHRAENIRDLAQKVFSATAAQDRQTVFDHFRPALSMTGNAANGKRLFETLCISCHRTDGTGNDLGPDLRSITDRSPEGLLRAIVDPNNAVEPRYLAYTCELTNGEEIYGLIASETSNSITLKLADGAARQILRAEIRSLRATDLSLMPEGLDSGLSPQEMADLIQFVRSL
jgi:putative membrane-bound dehydrogenase-like protein